MRRLIVAILLLFAPAPAMAAELLMFDANGCYWCDRWKKEVGRYFHTTREGRIAPLRLISLDRPMPRDVSWIRKVRASPTFVMIHQGREVGRIVGYRGEHVFWANMDDIMRNLPNYRP